MMRAEPSNHRTAGTDTYHSTMFTLLLDLNLASEQRWIQFELHNSPSTTLLAVERLHLMAKYTLPFGKPVWNRITTKIFDIFRIITLKQQKFSESDPVLIQQFSKKLQSDPVLIRQKLASVLIQSDPVLIRAHLCSRVIQPPCQICSLLLEVDDFSIGCTSNFVSQLHGYDFLSS